MNKSLQLFLLAASIQFMLISIGYCQEQLSKELQDEIYSGAIKAIAENFSLESEDVAIGDRRVVKFTHALKDGTSLYMFSGQLKRTIASGETRTKTFAASVALDSQKKHEVHKLMVEEGDGVSVRYMSPDALENVKDVARTLKQLKKDAGSNHPEYREAVREVDARMGPEMRFLEHSIYRTWSTPDGKFTVKGKHLSHDSKSIVLGRKDNGKKISVPYSKLSEKCKRFIAQNFDDVSFDGVVAP